ncbi:DUF6882 domain-containing protein [Dactylosporangium sp. NPDC051541]|uniref:DUF6882 domain-containing protein n=1 Tax=Dactylosporangium sp. NPDC051541 TaxID=3363977 RepID=UPI0037BA870A
MTFDELFAQHVATGMARQLALADVLGERDWQLDLTAGQATFGGDLRYGVQLLGSESQGERSWLWAWANEAGNLPPALLNLATWLRDFGQREGVAEFTTPGFPLARADGHRLALVASSLTGRPYYRGPYDGGAVFFHLEGTPPEVTAPVRPERALTVLQQIIAAFPVDHRTMTRSFLGQQGWTLDETPAAIVARDPSGATLRIDFDDLGRLSKLSGTLGPR